MGENNLNKTYFYANDTKLGWNFTTFLSLWNDFYRDDEDMKYFEFTLILLLCTIGLVVNMTLIVFFSMKKGLRSNQNRYVIAIMCTSIVFLPFSFLTGATRLTPNGWQFGNITCKLTIYLLISAAFVKTWLMAVISIDRYRKVVCGKDISQRLSVLLILLSIVIPSGTTAIMVFPNVFTKDIEYQGDQLIICSAGFEYNPRVRISVMYYSILLTLYFFIPQAVIAVCYTKIMRAISKSTRSLEKHGHFGRTVNSNNQKSKTTKILILIVVLFTIMWLPLFAGLAFSTLDHVVEAYAISARVLLGVECVLLANTVAEPFLYSFTSSNVREEMRLCCRRLTKSSKAPTETTTNTTTTTAVSVA